MEHNLWILIALHFADNFSEEKSAEDSFNSESSGYSSALDEKEAKARLLSMQSAAGAGIFAPQPTIKTEPRDDEDGTAV